MIYYRK